MADTDKITKSKDPVLGLMDFIKKAKANPWVLVAAAIGGGTGGQETLKQVFGQNVQWWWIAGAVVAYGLLSYLADAAKRQDKFAGSLERLADEARDIKNSVKGIAGSQERLEANVEELNRWKADIAPKLERLP